MAKLRFKDFLPKFETVTGRKILGFNSVDKTFESFDEAVEAANEWIRMVKPKLVNIETVLLPNMYSDFEEGSKDTDLNSSSSTGNSWHQFVRVWYEDKE